MWEPNWETFFKVHGSKAGEVLWDKISYEHDRELYGKHHFLPRTLSDVIQGEYEESIESTRAKIP